MRPWTPHRPERHCGTGATATVTRDQATIIGIEGRIFRRRAQGAGTSAGKNLRGGELA